MVLTGEVSWVIVDDRGVHIDDGNVTGEVRSVMVM
jgi:hypothetical protein